MLIAVEQHCYGITFNKEYPLLEYKNNGSGILTINDFGSEVWHEGKRFKFKGVFNVKLEFLNFKVGDHIELYPCSIDTVGIRNTCFLAPLNFFDCHFIERYHKLLTLGDNNGV